MPDDIPNIPRRRGKKNRPIESSWRQQDLPAYRPHVTVGSAIPVTLCLGFALIAVGVVMFIGTNHSLEVETNYTDCEVENTTQVDGTKMMPFSCSYSINLTQDYTGEVKFYYGMDKFYQNNRQYLFSRNDLQLTGDINNTQDCAPLDNAKVGDYTFPYVPCGQIANSMFNDTFRLFYHASSGTDGRAPWLVPVPWTGDGVLTTRERNKKFKNPSTSSNQTLCELLANTRSPPDWSRPLCLLGQGDNVGIGLENLDFQVWMKPAALPKFRKLYRILNRQANFSCDSLSTTTSIPSTSTTQQTDYDSSGEFNYDYYFADPVITCLNQTNGTFNPADIFAKGLPAGIYTLLINYNYPVAAFNGSKYFIITRENWVGPRNYFLPILYLIVGTFLILVSILFLIIWLWQRFKKN